MSVERRTLLKTTAAGAAVGGPFAGIVAMSRSRRRPTAPPDPGALVPIPDERDGAVRLHLPKGFKYRSFHDTEAPVTLTDGTALPGRHDGMGAFDGPRRSVILVRNHELNNPPPPRRAPLPPYTHFGPGRPYDEAAGGGTTTIQVTPDRRGDPVVHQPQRHDDELLRRPDAVGRLDHLRGDRERPRRQSGLHRRLERAAQEAARLRLRGAGQPPARPRPVQPQADHPRRPVRARGGVVRPEGRPPLPDRGQLRVPVRLLPLPRRRGTR